MSGTETISHTNGGGRLTRFRINCRLPQTPRTPSTAAAHYFDDIFSRSTKPGGSKPTRIRRSSTTRSIGNQSSFGVSVNGDHEDTKSTADSAHLEEDDNDETLRRRNEANEHIANYVTNQLERIRSNESVGVCEDEFEAQLDEN